MSFRILTKGTDDFCAQTKAGAHKLSAVERLAADKAKYVKSQQVALTHQAPIKTTFTDPGKMLGISTSPAHEMTRKPAEVNDGGGMEGPEGRRRPALNRNILNILMDHVCAGPGPFKQSSWSTSLGSWSPPSRPQTVCSSLSAEQEKSNRILQSLNHCTINSSSCTSFQPNIVATPCPIPAHAPGVSAPYSSTNRVDAQVETRTFQRESVRKHSSVHCSKSDLSESYSRTTADLECFFNYCGLDPEEVDCMGGVDRFTRANWDVLPISKFSSISRPSSEADWAKEDEGDEDDEDGPPRANLRVPYSISVIERNARVIKWLYGIHQARDANHLVSNSNA